MQYLEIIKQYLTSLGLNFSQSGFIWSLVYLVLIFTIYLFTRFLTQWLTPLLREQMRKIHGKPRLLRFLSSFVKKLHGLLFCLLLYFAIEFLQFITWPSYTYLLRIILLLVLAWVVLDIVSKGIRNKLFGRIFFFVVWGAVALNILQLLPRTVAFLNEVSFSLGEQHLTLLELTKGLVMFSIAIWASILLARFLSRRIDSAEDISPSVKVLFSKLIKAVLIILAVIVSLNFIGIDFTTLAVFSGAIGIGLGFGLQKIAANLISGFILLMDKSIKPGDVISVGNTFGFINALSARYVSVVARDGREYLIPNEELITNQVVNWSHSDELVRIDVEFGTSYHDDPELVRRLACQAATEHKRVISLNKPVCHIVEFGDSSINYKLRFWITDPHNGITNVKGDIYLLLWKQFENNNVNIPFPQREVRIKNKDE